jgi:hypothetical protein
MKVKCIYKGTWVLLTFGKTYDVIKIDSADNYYWIINDSDRLFNYPKKHFKLLSEIRNEKIDKLLKDES